jgi:hypothetical protein
VKWGKALMAKVRKRDDGDLNDVAVFDISF